MSIVKRHSELAKKCRDRWVNFFGCINCLKKMESSRCLIVISVCQKKLEINGLK